MLDRMNFTADYGVGEGEKPMIVTPALPATD